MYTERNKCIFCTSDKLCDYFTTNLKIPVGSYNVEDIDTDYKYIPFNVVSCEECLTFQTKYLGDLNEIYKINHADAYGNIRNTMNIEFSKLIKTTIPNISGIVEIGAGSGILSENILEILDTQYTIIDPFYFGNITNKTVIKEFIENVDLNTVNGNTVVMSHVFEHFYEPLDVIRKICNNNTIEYICLNFPDLETYIQKGTYHVLNPEHTYYVNNSFIIALFQKYGFDILEKGNYKEHSVFFIFKRSENIINQLQLYNINSKELITSYYNSIYTLVNKIQFDLQSSDNNNRKNYIWPCSMHTLYLFAFGLDSTLFTNILDNSSTKINKYIYGHKLLCKSFTEIASNKTDQITIIINGGCFNKELVLNSTPNVKYIMY
jgi:hypothetical protein